MIVYFEGQLLSTRPITMDDIIFLKLIQEAQ